MKFYIILVRPNVKFGREHRQGRGHVLSETTERQRLRKWKNLDKTAHKLLDKKQYHQYET